MSDRRKRRGRAVAAVVALVFLHFALRPVFEDWFVAPNFLVCAVLVTARQVRPGWAAGVGFLLGLLEDAVAVSAFGLATLLLVLLGYVGSRTRDWFLGDELLFAGTYLFVGTWTFEALLALAGGAEPLLRLVLLRGPLDALATGAFGYLVFPLVRSR